MEGDGFSRCRSDRTPRTLVTASDSLGPFSFAFPLSGSSKGILGSREAKGHPVGSGRTATCRFELQGVWHQTSQEH